MKKERIPSLDFVRVVCTAGIIANHFAHSSGNLLLQKYLYHFPNGNGGVGNMLVTVFFLLSGAALYYNHEKPESLKKFYIRRWQAIYPSYYVTYALLLIGCALVNRSFFTGRRVPALIWTVLGMDGYLSLVTETWAVIGEWFIGALIICYLLYPLIVYCLEKAEIPTCLALIVLFALTLGWNMLNRNAFCNIFSCLIRFAAGIVLMKHRDRLNVKAAGLISLPLLLGLTLLPVTPNKTVPLHMEGLLLFFVLTAAGQYVMKNAAVSRMIQAGARFSFEVFLVHHILLDTVLHFVHPESPGMLLLLLAGVMLLCGTCGWTVYRIRTGIVRIIRGKEPAKA